MDDLAREYTALVLSPLPVADDEHIDLGQEALKEKLLEQARQHRQRKEDRLGLDLCRQLERYVLLNTIDQRWRDHLNELLMLRSGIGLRSFGQRNPLIEYKRESLELFEQLLTSVQRDSVSLFFRAELVQQAPQPAQPDPAEMQAQHQDVNAYEQAGAGGPMAAGGGTAPQADPVGKAAPVKREEPKVGRNDPCPCGSGKKYKHCHGA